MPEFRIGQLVSYRQSSSRRRYCVIRRIIGNDILGVFENTPEEAVRNQTNNNFMHSSMSMDRSDWVIHQDCCKKTKFLIDGKNMR